jgi:hypothetical protein
MSADPAVIPSPSPLRKKPLEEQASTNDQQQYDPRSDTLYRWYLGATVAGVAGGLIGLVFLIVQTVASKKSADAALLNTQALVSSQRARIVVEVSRIDKAIDRVGDFRFEAVAINTGSTIAEIIGVWALIHHCGIEVLRDFENAELPEPPDGAFREPHTIRAYDRWLFRTIDPSDLVPFEVKYDVADGKIYPVWYGWIQFRDFVGREHRQRFFFMYSEKSKKLLPVGPAGQNAEEY